MSKVFTLKICVTLSTYDHQLYSSILYKYLRQKVYNQIGTETFLIFHIGRAGENFQNKAIFLAWAAPKVTR